MASLSTVLFLLLPLVSLYFSHAAAAGTLLGGTCTNNATCSPIANSLCNTGKKCQCFDTYYKENNTVCKLKIAVGGNCNASVPCGDDNAVCMTTCKCKDTHFEDSNSCILRISPNITCGSSGNSSCVDNAYCNKTNFCECGKGFTASKTSCNSAVTMAVAEISTLILCILLTHLQVLK
ncbi:uncharacterized protein LOC143045194 isoform X3 [Mytilus galloprovincialis]|uniref:uncharacterized protein LOC143045194 isoform X3 n=1 Tax=Mytilus galloprovincialis TaxID=29158 RepID=UPI003F7C715B